MRPPARTIILDDDPTGSQCASDIDLHLVPDAASILAIANAPDESAYLLTNARALDEDTVAGLISGLSDAAATLVADPWLLLRGDSTLRGHTFTELENAVTEPVATILVPAFPDGGRFTQGGVHYCTIRGVATPVADTEFAADPVFGFGTSRLDEWTRETSQNRWSACLITQASGPITPERIAQSLDDAQPRQLVVPDVVTNEDIETVAKGIESFRSAGGGVLVRSASPLAARLAGSSPRPVPTPQADRIIVACGSHTAGATRQLDRLGAATVVIDTDTALADPVRAADAMFAVATRLLDSSGVVVVSTERLRRREHGSLEDGSAVMAALCHLVEQLAPAADLIVTKGGITAAEVARTALHSRTVRILGQVETGIPLWRHEGADGTMHQVVIPGNVGSDDVLDDIVTHARRHC